MLIDPLLLAPMWQLAQGSVGGLVDLLKHGWIDQQIKVKVKRERQADLHNAWLIRFQLHQIEDTTQDLCQPKQLCKELK